jgi:hypothetical protein
MRLCTNTYYVLVRSLGDNPPPSVLILSFLVALAEVVVVLVFLLHSEKRSRDLRSDPANGARKKTLQKVLSRFPPKSRERVKCMSIALTSS